MKDSYHATIYTIDRFHWWYRVRRTIVHSLIKTYVLPERHKPSILDVGCGTGVLLSELSQYGESYGIDTSSSARMFCIDRGIKNVSEGNVLDIGFQQNTLDLVLALDIIEHVDDDSRALAEIYRVLKPGGIAILFVPAYMYLWGTTDVFSEHKRRYTRPMLCERTQKTGFELLHSSYFNTFLFPFIALWRLSNRVFKFQKQSDMEVNGTIMNKLFYWIFFLESKLLRFVSFPFGVSILLVCRKPITP